MKKITAFILLVTFFNCCLAQAYLEPFTGYQSDLSKNNFKQINAGLQYSLKKNKRYEFILQVQKSLPLIASSSDSSFTANPALPLYANAKKTIKPATWSFAIGNRIKIAGGTSANIFSIIIYTGVTYQNIKVAYQYDKANYAVLNPDKTLKRAGLFVSGGAEYMRQLKKGRLFVQLQVASPPLGKKLDYPASFGFIAPLAFNAGYSIALKKQSREK